MNPTDNTSIPSEMDDQRQRQQIDGTSNTAGVQNSITGNELISYQQGQQPIDFTDFLNIDDNDLALNALNASGSFVKDE